MSVNIKKQNIEHTADLSEKSLVDTPTMITDEKRYSSRATADATKLLLDLVVKDRSTSHQLNALTEENTNLKVANEGLKDIAEHDSLTGLLNKGPFLKKLETALEDGKKIGLLFIDLNNFKLVNDQISHPAGDYIIESFAELLKSNVRTSDELGYGGVSNDTNENYQIGRFGGDEFWIMVDLDGEVDVSEEGDRVGAVGIDALTVVSDRIEQAIPAFIESREYKGESISEKLQSIGFNAAIGAVVPEENESIDDFVARASNVMHMNKEKLKSVNKLPRVRKLGRWLRQHSSNR